MSPGIRLSVDIYGNISSLVLPGYVVLSKIIIIFECIYFPILSITDTIYDISGFFSLFKGVGTQIEIASSSFTTLKSFVAFKVPLATNYFNF